MAAGRRRTWNGRVFTMFLCLCALEAGRLEAPLQAQPPRGIGSGSQFGGERRRGELLPLEYAGGSRVEFKSLRSAALGTEQPYSVFLPPSYATETARTYPVVYFLHGLNNDHTSWTVERYGNLPAKLETLILGKKVPEIIMVHPLGDNSFYCNRLDGSLKHEDFVVEDLVKFVESNYRARPGRRNRAIAGTSMGGYGALKIAMKYSDRYAATAAHSPIIFLGKNPLDVPEEMKTSRYYRFFVSILVPLFGDPLRQDLWDANNPLILGKSGRLDGLKLYFDYGTADRYIESIGLDRGIKALDVVLTEADVPHSFKEYPGEPHGWELVSAHLQDSLPFLCQSFE